MAPTAGSGGQPSLGALELRGAIARGDLSATELAHACLDRVRAVEGEVRAWAWLDEGHVMAEAERLDAWRRAGEVLGPLHGLPVGVKDIIDTAGIPTESGTSLDRGRVPNADAAAVCRLKAAGAYIFGKTVTAELAFLYPGLTTSLKTPRARRAARPRGLQQQ
jgi:Asp-tRNA(Asn)/Glu-tRNA(Gln) amidotransferase A subunit family amidase